LALRDPARRSSLHARFSIQAGTRRGEDPDRSVAHDPLARHLHDGVRLARRPEGPDDLRRMDHHSSRAKRSGSSSLETSRRVITARALPRDSRTYQRTAPSSRAPREDPDPSRSSASTSTRRFMAVRRMTLRYPARCGTCDEALAGMSCAAASSGTPTGARGALQLLLVGDPHQVRPELMRIHRCRLGSMVHQDHQEALVGSHPYRLIWRRPPAPSNRHIRGRRTLADRSPVIGDGVQH
jgi:hypothetical protein